MAMLYATNYSTVGSEISRTNHGFRTLLHVHRAYGQSCPALPCPTLVHLSRPVPPRSVPSCFALLWSSEQEEGGRPAGWAARLGHHQDVSQLVLLRMVLSTSSAQWPAHWSFINRIRAPGSAQLFTPLLNRLLA